MSNQRNKNDATNHDNRSRQLNPEHDAYWRSRGEPGRPANESESSPAAPAAPSQKPG